MKKHIALCAGLMALGLGLTACSGAKDSAETAAEETTAGTATTEAASETSSEEESSAAANEVEPEGLAHIPVTVEERALTSYASDTQALVAEADYFTLALPEEAAKEYPALATTLDEKAKDDAAKAQDKILELAAEFQDIAEYSSDFDSTLTEKLKPKVMRADANILSILCEGEAYSGGAHGDYWTEGRNYDPASGRELKLSDVVPDREKLTTLVREKFSEKYTTAEFGDALTNAADYLATLSDSDYEATPWTMDSEGLTLYFPQYTLGPYAAGAQDLSIAFTEAPELFSVKYLETCDAYVIPLVDARTYELALGDGKPVAVSVELSSDGVSDTYTCAYSIGNTSLHSENYCYSAENYIVYAGGEHYIYSFSSSDNDYMSLEVVDVEKKSLEEGRSVNASLYRPIFSWSEEGDYDMRSTGGAAFTNPEHMVLERRMEVLGTTSGRRSYHVGADGYPESDDAYYTLPLSYAIRTKKEMTLDTVDAKGEKTGTETIPAGTYLIGIRSDADQIEDLQLIDASELNIEEGDGWSSFTVKDGSDVQADLTKPIYRVTVDHSDWPNLVNGEAVDQLFDGVIYAG